jgi:hypothetical protein
VFSREFDQSVDLIGHVNFLVERQFYRVASCLEFGFRRINGRNRHASSGVDDVFDKPQRVALFFLCLSEKMLRELRQRLRGEMRTNRIILKRSAELVSDLLVDGVDDLLTR